MVKDKLKNNKILVFILSCLILIIVGLVVSIIIIFATPKTMSSEDYRNLASDIMLQDNDNSRGEEVIDYLLKADELDPSINSAVLILNTANHYKLTNIWEQYTQILIERELEEGLDPDLETIG